MAYTGKTKSMPAGIAIGTAASLAITAAGVAVIAEYMNNGGMKEDRIGIGIMILLIVAAAIGSIVSWKQIRHRRMLVSLLAGLSYYLILIASTALLFGGQYESADVGFLLVLCGSIVPALLDLNRKVGTNRRRIKIKNR